MNADVVFKKLKACKNPELCVLGMTSNAYLTSFGLSVSAELIDFVEGKLAPPIFWRDGKVLRFSSMYCFHLRGLDAMGLNKDEVIFLKPCYEPT